MPSIDDLKARQALPLEAKIIMSQSRIRSWYEHFRGDVYVSFSGGKDSTVLLDLVRNTPGVYDVPAVFVDTGLEYPEVRKFAASKSDIVLRPKMNFKQVIDHYGYPVVSKEQALFIRQYRHSRSDRLRVLRWNGFPPNGRFAISKKWRFLTEAPFEVSEKCCDIMKKSPFKNFEKDTGRKPYIGTMAEESRLRLQQYSQNGCNSFGGKMPKSTPLGFWTEQDVLRYIKDRHLCYASVYGEIVTDDLFGEHLKLTGCTRTGCMFCMFGVHLDPQPNRFQRMRKTHPKQYAYCIDNLGIGAVLDYMGVPY